MQIVIALLLATAVGSLTLLLAQLLSARPRAVTDRLAEVQALSSSPFQAREVKRRLAYRERLEGILRNLGERYQSDDRKVSSAREFLLQAGIRDPDAVSLYRGARIIAPVLAGGLGIMLLPLQGGLALLMAAALAMVAWVAPVFYVGLRRGRRMKDLQKALPDALDALVVCVEAGLGLNQAMVRVADEIRHMSVVMSEEMTLTNLEMRAGVPRDEALRNFARRTGLPDIRSLVTMVVQTQRFGTSIAQALRVQSDTMREKRKQKADEIVNKMTIKMLFPLVFCIFPAMFVIALGPAIMQIMAAFGSAPF